MRKYCSLFSVLIVGVLFLSFNSVSNATATGGATYLSQWGFQGSNEGNFSGPQDATVDSLGNVYVVDTFDNRIVKFATQERISQSGEHQVQAIKFCSCKGKKTQNHLLLG